MLIALLPSHSMLLIIDIMCGVNKKRINLLFPNYVDETPCHCGHAVAARDGVTLE